MTNEMTNEEVIEYFKKNVIRIKGIMAEEDEALKDRFSQTLEATEMAIKALETIPKYKDAYNKGWCDGAWAVYEHLKMCEEEQEPTGHWEWLTEDKYRCSNCNSETRVDECLNEPMYEFCPFCGAKMTESEG